MAPRAYGPGKTAAPATGPARSERARPGRCIELPQTRAEHHPKVPRMGGAHAGGGSRDISLKGP